MSSSRTATVIDASLRFARSNPEVLAYAQEHAMRTGAPVDALLADAVARVAEARRDQAGRRQWGAPAG